jgi:hypothetical protein
VAAETAGSVTGVGTHTDSFKCPHCDSEIASAAGPNFTATGGPGPDMSAVIVLSCPSCEKALGAYLMPPTD